MKVTMLALAFAACATTVSAYAANPATNPADAAPQHSQHSQQWTPAQNAPQAKTRAEVRQELVRAQNDGQLAALNKLYQGS
jgi:Domain of unknown function (DUF4148)